MAIFYSLYSYIIYAILYVILYSTLFIILYSILYIILYTILDINYRVYYMYRCMGTGIVASAHKVPPRCHRSMLDVAPLVDVGVLSRHLIKYITSPEAVVGDGPVWACSLHRLFSPYIAPCSQDFHDLWRCYSARDARLIGPPTPVVHLLVHLI